MNKMKEKMDTVEKEFVSFPDIAADVINVLLYEGKKVTQVNNLCSGPTETVYQGWKCCEASMRICANMSCLAEKSDLCI